MSSLSAVIASAPGTVSQPAEIAPDCDEAGAEF
jgi:hypothetical protein